MAPIRVGIIGLSSSAVTSWAAGAHLPYLQSARGRSHYDIVALCNSSVEAARRAIQNFGFDPAKTRAYGNPADLAADPDVQLVVSATRVDLHYETIKPSIEAGKDVFVEWPLAHNIERVRELKALAEEKGVKSAVGVQGRLSPIVLKVKEVVESGVIGKVLSSEIRAAGGSLHRDIIPQGLKYFTDKKIGGNILTIGAAHTLDYVQSAIGEIKILSSRTQIQRPDVRVRDISTGQIVETIKSDVPDLIIAVGTLAAAPHVKDGSTVLFRYRRGQSFKDEPGLVWTINGEKGELRVISTGGPGLNAGATADAISVEVHDFEKDEVTSIEWKWPEWEDELPERAKGIAALYEAIAAGNTSAYADFAAAAQRHEQLEVIFPSSS